MFSGLHLKFLKSILKTKFPFDCFCTEKRAEQGLCYFKEHCVRKGLEEISDATLSGCWTVDNLGCGQLIQLLDSCIHMFCVVADIPMLYEKHEDKVDPVAEKTLKELKKHYMVRFFLRSLLLP
ncbi:unnamed protein product [Brassica rapa subsp. trilocularis]